MRNETPDRQQMHEDLQELAKLGATPSPGAARDQAHGFETADSSGYVDLSAYRADDESWIERELARAKAGVGPSGQRAIDGLAPQSMAPVALESLLAADDKLEDEAPPRRRWPLALGGIASVAAVAALAFVVTRNAPHTAPKATQAAAPPPVATQPASTSEPMPTQAPETAQQAPSPSTSAATATASTSATSSEPVAKKPHSTHASRGHASAPATAAARPAAARPVAVPASHPVKSSGDSLMDAIRASVKK